MSYPRIYCINCRQLNDLTVTEMGDGPIAIYSCSNCGIVVEPPGEIRELKDGKHGLQEETEEASQIEFKALCDKCKNSAYVEVVMPSEFGLAFCSHHFEEHKEALLKQGGTVTDHRAEKLGGYHK